MKNDGARVYHCLPIRRPDYCPHESWNELVTVFEGERCDGRRRQGQAGGQNQQQPGTGVQLGAPAYLTVEGHRDCLGSKRAGSSFVLCMPSVRPAICMDESWHRLKSVFEGERCSPESVSLDQEEFEDCLGSYRAGFKSWELCVPRKRPKFCDEGAWIRLQFESDKETCPHLAGLCFTF